MFKNKSHPHNLNTGTGIWLKSSNLLLIDLAEYITNCTKLAKQIDKTYKQKITESFHPKFRIHHNTETMW